MFYNLRAFSLSLLFVLACAPNVPEPPVDGVCEFPESSAGFSCLSGLRGEPRAEVSETFENGLRITRNIHYASAEGFVLEADLIRPREDAPATRGAMVLIHGGGWNDCDNRRNTLENFGRVYADFWNIPVWNLDYRLVDEGGAFPENLNDVMCALSFIKEKAGDYGTNADNVIVVGSSAGGQLALMTGAVENLGAFGCGDIPDIRSIVSFSGPTDMNAMIEDSVARGAARDNSGECSGVVEQCSAETSCERCVQASPIAHACAYESDVVLIYADDPFDPLVPATQAKRFAEALEGADKNVDLVVVEDETLRSRGCLPWDGSAGVDLQSVAHGTSGCLTQSGSEEIAAKIITHLLPLR